MIDIHRTGHITILMSRTSPFSMRHRTQKRPPNRKCGDAAFFLPEDYLYKRHEVAVTVSFIARRELFGLAYLGLQPDFFRKMPMGSGVYVCPIIPTIKLTDIHKNPGDIDLLIIPYELDELILDRTVALEIKAVRASFGNQGKSPNQFGFSQVKGLFDMGFPYVGLAI